MLVVAGGDRTRLDTGSLALALGRRLSESDRRALFVDADATGSRLARRCGRALGAPFSPAARGLPTLIAARDPMRVDALAAHCYSLGARPESLWLLFAPDSAAGGRVAGGWLAERAAELRELDRTRRVIVSVPSWQQFDAVLPLLEHASALVHHKRFAGEGTAEAFAAWLRQAGLSGSAAQLRLLLAEADSPPADDALQRITGLEVIGRLPLISDEKLLRMRFRGRDSSFGTVLAEVTGRLSGVIDATGDPGTVVTSLPQDRLAAPTSATPARTGAGADAEAESESRTRQWRRRDVSA
ncbi:MAG: hypothetical protein OXG69_03505 [bacterium]|nr:hypothetical protein [bacterium]